MNHITLKLEPRPRHPLLRPWPGLVVAVLVLHSGLMITAAVVAAAGGPPAVEPRFYEKAIAWDATAAQRQANKNLGWTVAWHARTGPAGTRVRITDAAGAPVDGAACTVEFFHRAHSRDRRFATLTPAGDGTYALPDALVLPGEHEFRLTVRAPAALFTNTSTATCFPREVPAP